MKSLDEKRQTILFCLAGVLIVMLFPGRIAWESIQSTRDEVDTIQTETTALEAKAEQGAAVQLSEAEWQARLEAVQVAIPKEEAFAEVNAQIAQAATTAGVIWKSGQPDATAGEAPAKGARTIGGAKVYSLGLSDVSGSADQVRSFISGLALIPRVVIIDSVDWRQEVGDPIVTADIRAGYLAGGAITKPVTESDQK